ncbi:uncharacterized protein SAPINGB_P000013 [Magnusiomyces paraingens]|uniref:Acid phosphatase n=1 Tax=Magnusiomyces paraingens TaxID=2606893 RepID=A0A5E8AWU8_9ASCO|nr:uncharacterized protein SAPINGB_P000013 [Saprochaete ingens]VVT43497.1 unnamed protein product [Saprochaete ingens]
MIHRHNERYPTMGAGAEYKTTLDKFTGKNITGPLAFLKDYQYHTIFPSEKHGELTTLGPYNGIDGAFKKGQTFKKRYDYLLDKFQGDFPIFTASSHRDQITAQYFSKGLGINNTKIVVVPESATQGANSLTPDRSCPKYDPGTTSNLKSYLYVFNDTLFKLQHFAPNVDITIGDISNLLDMCGFELTAVGSQNFCEIFSDYDHVLHGYGRALRYYYKNGPGNDLSATLGSVYANATLTLLQQEPHIPVYISFTHDTHINFFLSTLGIFSSEESLPYDYAMLNHPWVRGDNTPMGGEVVIEKMNCSEKSFVRILVNEAVVPFHNCTNGPGTSCPLETFTDILGDKILDYREACLDSSLPQYLSFFWDWDP